MKYTYTIKTPLAMERLAKKIASKAPQGTTIALTGSLGSGKSVFARGFIRSFGIKEHILSPTFTLLQQYDTPRCSLYHFDLYRLSSAEEFDLIGGAEALRSQSSYSLVEWPEIIEDYLDKKSTIFVNISVQDDLSREVCVECQFEI